VDQDPVDETDEPFRLQGLRQSTERAHRTLMTKTLVTLRRGDGVIKVSKWPSDIRR
jgi:hypothetical protein